MNYIIVRKQFAFGKSYLRRNSSTWTQIIELAETYDTWEEAIEARTKIILVSPYLDIDKITVSTIKNERAWK